MAPNNDCTVVKVEINESMPNGITTDPMSEPCSICLDIFHHKRLEIWYNIYDYIQPEIPGLTLEDCKFLFHRCPPPLPEYEVNLCTFCAHLRLECLVETSLYDLHISRSRMPKASLGNKPGGYLKVLLDRVSDTVARKNSCSLCALIAAVFTGRNSVDPSQHAVLEITPYTMSKITFRARDKSGDETYGISLHGNHYSDKIKNPGSMLDCSVSSHIDWPAVTQWITESLDGVKKKPQSYELNKPPDEFRVIDVQELRVVLAPTPCEYMCLSYVWGRTTSFHATSRNISRLERPNSLANPHLPRTIRDAIKACALLGGKYLWVDRLCILQDDDSPSKKVQIDAMGDIYKGTLLTLVALEGTDSDYGLHGVSPDLERTINYRLQIGGKEFFKYPTSLYQSCDNSTWDTRGWTFQERILSPRLLFFTANSIYYESDTQNEIYDPIYDQAGSSYEEMVSEIQYRNFGIEEDIVNGFAGALEEFVGKGNHRFSMSLVHFDEAITWNRTGSSPAVLCATRGSTVFPSWSWVSIRGFVWFVDGLNAVPVASWAVIDGMASEFRWLKAGDENHLHEDAIAVGTLLWSHDCLRTPIPLDLKTSSGYDVYLELFRQKFPTQGVFNAASGVWPGGQQGFPDLRERFTQQQIEAGRQSLSILAHSQTIVLALIPPRRRDDKWGLHYQGQDVGTMAFDLRAKHDEALRHTNLDNEPQKMEFLALSVSWVFAEPEENYWYKNPVDELDDTGNFKATNLGYYLEKDKRSRLEDFSMSVMAIETTDDGISRRLGFGRISFIKWLTILNPTFKSIVLQ
ncbi:HET-domain-containing protein [Aspergillus sclerotioniger CBS 115572]|uniref:HET-domain-containing protein n=1 Tax=Aspergillus sclerotioniger CBS 115572 TaxID=1450535 RepID=A0A317V1F1_9EURO|nr:HET-domain-containing protein [Aspergillus sclerotioniger CBS 115572]PWY67221.1 HET-domain-containing protein [Aspergillus sclerotioniger CBS 115572]